MMLPTSPNTAAAAAATTGGGGGELDPEFLALLRCPACEERPPVHLSSARDALGCERCGRRYPIVDGLPDLVIEDAQSPANDAALPRA